MDEDDRRVQRDLLRSVRNKVMDGRVEDTEVELASWIASGKLREHKVVDALIKTFYEAQRNMARGRLVCPGTTTHLSDEVLGELMTTLAGALSARFACIREPSTLNTISA